MGPASTFWPPPITLTLILIAALVSLLTDFGSPSRSNSLGLTLYSELLFLSPSYFTDHPDEINQVSKPAYSLLQGELWRIFTPIFLHFRPLHLLFNLFTVIPLGRLVERSEGSWRYGLFILAAAAFPNLLQGLLPPSPMLEANIVVNHRFIGG